MVLSIIFLLIIPHFKRKEDNMMQNSKIWYSKDDMFQKTKTITDYIGFLKPHIGKRIEQVRKEYGLLKKHLHPSDPTRIGLIEKGEDYKKRGKKYSSFITDTILTDIVSILNSKISRKTGNTSQLITRFWVIFGDDTDLYHFLKILYSNFCINILSATPDETDIGAELIQNFFYSDATFSLIYGLAKVDNKNINTPPNEKEHKALLTAIQNTWNIIYKDVIEKFKTSFNHNDPQKNYYIGNSKNLNNQINQWCNEILIPYLQFKQGEQEKDSISNIGYKVHDLMEILYQNKFINNRMPPNKIDSHYETTIEESNNLIYSCAKNLTEIQTSYLTALMNYENEVAISKSIAELNDNELDGDYIVVGTGEKITFGSSEKTFEQLINEAVKKCKKNT